MNAKQKIASAIGTGVLLVGATLWFKPQKAQGFPQNTAPSVSLAQAGETVLVANLGTSAVDPTLELENNVLAWKIELDNDT